MVSIGPLQKVSLHKGIQTLKQVLLIANINVESCEGLLSRIPAVSKSPEIDRERERESITCEDTLYRSSGQQMLLLKPQRELECS